MQKGTVPNSQFLLSSAPIVVYVTKIDALKCAIVQNTRTLASLS